MARIVVATHAPTYKKALGPWDPERFSWGGSMAKRIALPRDGRFLICVALASPMRRGMTLSWTAREGISGARVASLALVTVGIADQAEHRLLSRFARCLLG